ncbi:hypothetical protein SAMN05443633_10893 [Chryseobacterium arachidis]|uniref:Uncharacterized protein n=1 Tax=Chryseobacterium arachidis TaxID=1416778 RepID=A0A1M5FPW8_9FLAO|nr:hypothetical protein [Chryseobacterium arachidis]SHF93469.1 hypothetical protein SAMN05443633_10893 [Chryseobacterium arachidis]
MYPISKKINIGKTATVLKNTFSNDEIGQSAEVKFICCNCNHENIVKITPYESGFPFFQIYYEDKIVSKNELIKKGIAAETNKNLLHFGELTVNNLPTLYFRIDCNSCHAKYVCVFSYGEKQPGLIVLTVSGVWEYKETE